MKMKRVLLGCLVMAILNVHARAQNNVFVLVDVSRSIRQSDLAMAKVAITDLLLGKNLSNASVAFGDVSALPLCKLNSGDRLSIVRFGDKATIVNNTPNHAPVTNVPGDVMARINAEFPSSLTDNRTYITLAKAKIAEYAKVNQISEYRLLVITDEVADNYGSDGKPDYSDYELALTQAYGTSSSQIAIAPATKLRLTGGTDRNYVIEITPKIDVVKYQLPPNAPKLITAPVDEGAVIKLTSNAGGKRGKEIQLKSDMVNVSWSCLNCPAGAQFTVTISQYGGGNFRDKKTSSTNTTSFKVPDGDYKVTVAAENFTADNSDTTFVTVSTGGGGLIFGLLALVALGLIGFFIWNKKRSEKIDGPANNEADVFSKAGSKPASSSSHTNPNSNSEYF